MPLLKCVYHTYVVPVKAYGYSQMNKSDCSIQASCVLEAIIHAGSVIAGQCVSKD